MGGALSVRALVHVGSVLFLTGALGVSDAVSVVRAVSLGKLCATVAVHLELSDMLEAAKLCYAKSDEIEKSRYARSDGVEESR